MRLTDADAFKKQIAGTTIANNYPANKASALCDLIDAQPTAYDVDKVVAELEKSIVNVDDGTMSLEFLDGYEEGILAAIQIVKGGDVDGD